MYDSTEQIIGKCFASYSTYYPHSGWAEQNPEDWYRSVCAISKRLCGQYKCHENIVAISFSGQTISNVLIDHNGQLLYPAILHCDARATVQAEKLTCTLGNNRLYSISGVKANSSYPIEKMLWLKENLPDVYQCIYKTLGPKDYLVYRLCGRVATEYTEASMSGCFSLVDFTWSSEILNAAGIDSEKFPDILEPTTIAGYLSKNPATDMDLRPGIPIIMGGADGQCGCLGIAGADTAHAYGYLGSAGVVFASSETLLTSGNQNVVSINCHPVKGQYRYYASMQTCGMAYSWLRTLLSPTQGTAMLNFEEMNHLAEDGSGVLSGLYFLPYLLGERSPFWNANAKGCFIGITPKTTVNDMIRAVIEGIALNYSINFHNIMNIVPKSDIILYGGCAKSSIWQQIFSDILNVPVFISDIPDEAASLGAMRFAYSAINHVSINMFMPASCKPAAIPSVEKHEIYAKARGTFLSAYEGLIKTFESIASN